jgi:hypothetical protein
LENEEVIAIWGCFSHRDEAFYLDEMSSCGGDHHTFYSFIKRGYGLMLETRVNLSFPYTLVLKIVIT